METNELDELTAKWLELRKPFDANQISKLPRQTKQQAMALGNDYRLGIRCKLCGGYHHKEAIHLDYVGHAATTNRILDVDPNWSWEPLSYTEEGLPLIDKEGGLWIKLTILGVTRLGYGDAQGKIGGDAMKERIGDAIRNAAMRFGVALDLWHKGEENFVQVEYQKEKKTPKERRLDAVSSVSKELLDKVQRMQALIADENENNRQYVIELYKDLTEEEKFSVWPIFTSKEKKYIRGD